MSSYHALVCDPPWAYDNGATRNAAGKQYGLMSLAELRDLPNLCAGLAQAEDSHLYLWTTTTFLRDAFDLLEAWGYTYKTNLVWCKPQMGMGNYFRVSHEHVLFGTRGDIGRTERKDLMSYFTASRHRHSAKPDSFYDLVEQASPGPYLDIFSRSARFGWDCWGLESLNTMEHGTTHAA